MYIFNLVTSFSIPNDGVMCNTNCNMLYAIHTYVIGLPMFFNFHKLLTSLEEH